MTREVHVRRRAWADIATSTDSIIRTVGESSARSWRMRLERAISELSQDAGLWPESEDATELGIDLRCKPFDRRRHAYRILFTIEGERVIVHRVRYAAMNWLTADDL